MNQQMDRLEFTEDHAKRRELMDLHMKHMQEGMRELRKRDMPADCRIELMSSMMESMMRHQQLQQEPAEVSEAASVRTRAHQAVAASALRVQCPGLTPVNPHVPASPTLPPELIRGDHE
jgi:hypothetical protein